MMLTVSIALRDNLNSMDYMPSILIMDDEREIREALAKLLNHIGYNCSQSADGDEAIRMYTKAYKAGNPFDLVIMDLNIPDGMGGEEAAGHLQEIDPNVKAIVSSGHVTATEIPYYKSIGFKAVLQKPYTLGALTRAIKDAIDQT